MSKRLSWSFSNALNMRQGGLQNSELKIWKNYGVIDSFSCAATWPSNEAAILAGTIDFIIEITRKSHQLQTGLCDCRGRSEWRFRQRLWSLGRHQSALSSIGSESALDRPGPQPPIAGASSAADVPLRLLITGEKDEFCESLRIRSLSSSLVQAVVMARVACEQKKRQRAAVSNTVTTVSRRFFSTSENPSRKILRSYLISAFRRRSIDYGYI